jgi:hypothetical protein
VSLREPAEDDGPASRGIFDAEVTRFLGSGPRGDAETAVYLEENLAPVRQVPRARYLLLIEADGAAVGTVCPRVTAPAVASPGFAPGRAAWGRGHATAAVRAVLGFGFGRRRFWTPDVADADGLLFQFGTYAFDGPPTFSPDLVRQFEVADGAGEHDHYLQVHCELRFAPTEELVTLGSYSSWFFHDGDGDLEGWAAGPLARPDRAVIGGRTPAEVKVYREEVQAPSRGGEVPRPLRLRAPRPTPAAHAAPPRQPDTHSSRRGGRCERDTGQAPCRNDRAPADPARPAQARPPVSALPPLPRPCHRLPGATQGSVVPSRYGPGVTERPTHHWRGGVEEDAREVAAGTLRPEDAHAAHLWPAAMPDATDAVLDRFEAGPRTWAGPSDETVLGAVKRAVLALNAVNDSYDGAAYETDEREQLCCYFDRALAGHGIDVRALEARHGLDRHDVPGPWRDW